MISLSSCASWPWPGGVVARVRFGVVVGPPFRCSLVFRRRRVFLLVWFCRLRPLSPVWVALCFGWRFSGGTLAGRAAKAWTLVAVSGLSLLPSLTAVSAVYLFDFSNDALDSEYANTYAANPIDFLFVRRRLVICRSPTGSKVISIYV